MKADEIAARRASVATALLQHKSQRAIAAELSLTLPTVNSDIKALRREWAASRLDAIDQVADEDLQRLNQLEAVYLPKALAGDDKALDRVLKVMERRARLLGIDAPMNLDQLLRDEAKRMAEEMGLDADEVVASAERHLASLS